MWAQSGMNYNSSHRGCAFAWNPAEDSDRILWPRSVSSSPASLDGRSHRGCALAWRSRRGFKSYPLVSFCIFFTGKPRRLVSPRLRLCLEIPQRIQIVSSGLVLYPLHRRTWSVGLTAVAHLLVDPAEDSNRILWPRSISSSPPSPIGWFRRGCAFACRSRRGFKSYPLASFCVLFHRRAPSVGLSALAPLSGDPAEDSNRILWPRSMSSSPPSQVGWSHPGAPRSTQKRAGALRSAQERPGAPRTARRASAPSGRNERATRGPPKI